MKDELLAALDGMKADCASWVTRLNTEGNYAAASYMQQLLQQADATARRSEHTFPEEVVPDATEVAVP